jgi:hypothetical protein
VSSKVWEVHTDVTSKLPALWLRDIDLTYKSPLATDLYVETYLYSVDELCFELSFSMETEYSLSN